MAGWSSILQTGSWAGVEFEFLEVREQIKRVLDARRFPYVDDAAVDDRAREGTTFTVRTVWFDDAYPTQYERFRAAARAGGVRDFVHPVHGTFQAAVESASFVHDADERDAAMGEVTFVVDNSKAVGLAEVDTASSLAALVRAACDDATRQAGKLADYLAQLDGAAAPAAGSATAAAPDTTRSALGTVLTVANQLEDGVALTSAVILSLTNGALGQLGGATLAVGVIPAPEAVALGEALLRTGGALKALADHVLGQEVGIREIVLEVEQPAALVAHDCYGDASRAGELLQLNSISDPGAIPAGTRLRVYDR